jgi:hypothetical protein
MGSLDGRVLRPRAGPSWRGALLKVPKPRNTREENEQIKEGKVPESFKGKPPVKAQKDCDARWSKKGQTSYYGDKNHIKTDAKHKIVRDYEVTPASVHGSKKFVDFSPASRKKRKCVKRGRGTKRRSRKGICGLGLRPSRRGLAQAWLRTEAL